MGKIYRITVRVPETTKEYVVGEKEKDILALIYKDSAKIEELRTETDESPED